MTTDALQINSSVALPRTQEIRRANDPTVMGSVGDVARLTATVDRDIKDFEDHLNMSEIMTKSKRPPGIPGSPTEEFVRNSIYDMR